MGRRTYFKNSSKTLNAQYCDVDPKLKEQKKMKVARTHVAESATRMRPFNLCIRNVADRPTATSASTIIVLHILRKRLLHTFAVE